ncbi:MAG: FkbM family methyltransferase [Lachnospiraceae bacterium]|nr:FkbM family methyltransferase [Ruminococcus sp.]MCM1275239.1 FkbM family methyltransferase [Lachnospiraceae bacterium]
MAFFLDDISSDLWWYLRQCGKKVVLYGMGDGAEKIKAALDEREIPVADIMASDDFVRGQDFLGYRVKRLSEIEEEHDDFIILVCFGTQLPDIMDRIYGIAEKHELYAPNVPVVGEGLFDLGYAREHESELKKVFSLLADEQSKRVFENVIRYKLSGELKYLRGVETPSEEKFDLLNIGIEETYVDLGAYNGDTLIEFLNETSMQFNKLYAMEPDSRNYRKLKRRLYMIGSALLEAYNVGAWDEDTAAAFSLRAGRSSRTAPKEGKRANRSRYREVRMMKVDTMLRGAAASYIKIDVEGSEENALRGAAETIANFRPKLNVALYHRNEDMFKLPLIVNGMNKKYRLYMRHHPYIPDWDTNLYCV